jgi:hypothetical protein
MQTDTSQIDMQTDTSQTDEQADTLMTDEQAGTLPTDTPTTPWTDKQDTLGTEMMGTAVRNTWVWGFTPQAEMWNGRLVMIGFVSASLTELFAHIGILHFWGVMS